MSSTQPSLDQRFIQSLGKPLAHGLDLVRAQAAMMCKEFLELLPALSQHRHASRQAQTTLCETLQRAVANSAFSNINRGCVVSQSVHWCCQDKNEYEEWRPADHNYLQARSSVRPHL